MKTVVCRDPQEVSRKAAELFLSGVEKARHQFRVALSGGKTPALLYSVLSQEPYRGAIEWNKIEFFWGDERCVPPDHADNNYRMAAETLLSHVAVPDQNIHRIMAERNPEQAAQEYEDQIRSTFGLGKSAFPVFDLILLGMGEDGHTASLFPRTRALNEKKRIAVANHVPSQNAWRITLTVQAINHASCVVFLVTGKSKAGALQEVLHGKGSPKEFPAKMIRPYSGDLVFLVDREAMTFVNADQA